MTYFFLFPFSFLIIRGGQEGALIGGSICNIGTQPQADVGGNTMNIWYKEKRELMGSREMSEHTNIRYSSLFIFLCRLFF